MRKKYKEAARLDEYVKREYEARVEELRLVPFSASSAVQKLDEKRFSRIDDVLPGYDFEYTLESPFDCDDVAPLCVNDRLLTLFAKGNKMPYQMIILPHEVQEVLPQTNDDFDRAEMFDVVDYNFDGYPDFAVHTAMYSISGIKGYRVFLYDPADKLFYYAPGFSRMVYAQEINRDEKSSL